VPRAHALRQLAADEPEAEPRRPLERDHRVGEHACQRVVPKPGRHDQQIDRTGRDEAHVTAVPAQVSAEPLRGRIVAPADHYGGVSLCLHRSAARVGHRDRERT
jgi:hypothetical protein